MKQVHLLHILRTDMHKAIVRNIIAVPFARWLISNAHSRIATSYSHYRSSQLRIKRNQVQAATPGLTCNWDGKI